VERPAILQEIDKKAADVYMNMGGEPIRIDGFAPDGR